MAINVSQPNGSKKEDILYFHATIRAGKERVKITCLDEEQSIDDMKIDIEDLPDYPKFEQGTSIEDCQVIYDKAEDKVLAINPWNGIFEAVGIDLGPRPEEGADPHPNIQEKEGQDGKPYMDKSFHEVFKILDKHEYDGFFYGTTPRLFLKDKFYERPDGMTDIGGTQKSRWTVRLQKMVSEQKLGEEDIPWPEDGNVLPVLLERLLENEVRVRLVFENGWINSLTGIAGRKVVVDDIEDEDETPKKKSKKVVDEVDEEFPPVKETPKSKNGTKAHIVNSKVSAPNVSKLVKSSKVKQSHAEEEDDL